MGIDPRTLDKAVRDRLGMKLAGSHVQAQLSHGLRAWAWFDMAIEPPTTTHHDKKIKILKRGDRTSATLTDSEALLRTRATWERQIPQRREPCAPILPPVYLHVAFFFARPMSFTMEPHWMCDPPDLDNMVKALKDVLALRGYLANDKHVASLHLTKRFATLPRVLVYVQHLPGPGDGDLPGILDATAATGELHPLPSVTASDLRSIDAAGRTASLIAELNHPTHPRKPGSPRPRVSSAVHLPARRPAPPTNDSKVRRVHGRPKAPPPQIACNSKKGPR